jgi:choline-phosphate cytidylyltransferase
MERIKNVQDSGLADEVILEEYEGQKVNDMQKYDVDIFAIGSDWQGKFDYLNDYCKVVYLERTKGVSSTQLRNEDAGILRIGVVGTGRIAHRFVDEAVFVSGVDIEGAWSRDPGNVQSFVAKHELDLAAQSFDELLDKSDAVYIATPHGTHVDYALRAIAAGKHVLCEKPMALTEAEVVTLQTAAEKANVVLMEAIKTAYSPGFKNMVAVARTTQLIGDIRSVDATFTKLTSGDVRELDAAQDGGSLAELASYPLLAIVKLLGEEFDDMTTTSLKAAGDVDLYSRIDFRYPHAVASARTGLGVKAEGDLVVAGTKGYLYVPAPWWKTEYFEARFENQSDNKKYYYKFDGDGLRYEIAEFSSMIRKGESETFKLRASESRWFARVLESARADAHVFS